MSRSRTRYVRARVDPAERPEWCRSIRRTGFSGSLSTSLAELVEAATYKSARRSFDRLSARIGRTGRIADRPGIAILAVGPAVRPGSCPCDFSRLRRHDG